jgi:hypothetical protein
MNAHDEERMKKLLQEALPPVNGDAGPSRDLWPEMLKRLETKPAASGEACFNWGWFDGALAVGLVVLAACFPASIPLLLYYL